MILTESNFRDVEVLKEEQEGAKHWFLEGIFLQSDVVNLNRRLYPRPIMENEVSRYVRDFVTPRRAVGELTHPSSPEINLDKITHITESIRQEGTNFVGKAKILNTPSGNIVSGLLEGGVKLGVSSRGTGSVKQNDRGINEVQEDFRLAAVDIVWHPSAPNAFVEGLMENAEFVYGTISEDVEFVESIKRDVKQAKSKDLVEAKFKAFQSFMSMISNR